MTELTPEVLREHLHYNPNTGIFTRLKSSEIKYKNKKAGSVDEKGYVRISVIGKRYRAHRLAWFYTYGVWPKDQIDHINHDKADNRISNLREATNSENVANQSLRKTNTSGYKGVSFNQGKWKAAIRHNSKKIHLGSYDSPKQAHKAYCKAAKKLKGGFAHYG